MTLSSLWAAKCSGLFEDSPRGNVSCGRVNQVHVCEAMKAPVGLLSDRTVLRQQDGGASPPTSSHNANLIAPYASEKFAYGLQITCTVRTAYEQAKYLSLIHI